MGRPPMRSGSADAPITATDLGANSAFKLGNSRGFWLITRCSICDLPPVGQASISALLRSSKFCFGSRVSTQCRVLLAIHLKMKRLLERAATNRADKLMQREAARGRLPLIGSYHPHSREAEQY